MSFEVSIKEATPLIEDCFRAGLVPMLHGSPGVGKSACLKAIAEKYKLELVDIRLSQVDPTDLMGLPMREKDSVKAEYVPLNTFPLAGEAKPAGKRGWLLFLDEINSAPRSIQAAAYRLVLDREVGIHKLHKDVYIACAGNLVTDKAITVNMGTAMQSRLTHLIIRSDAKSWLEWAHSANIDWRITAYIQEFPHKLNQFNPDHNDHTFACERTWDMLSSLIKPWKELDITKYPVMAGTVSGGVALEFAQYAKIANDLPTIQTILDDPKTAKLPDEPSARFLVTGCVAAHTNPDNIDKMLDYLDRLPKEFQVIGMQSMIKRNTELENSDAVQQWITSNIEFFMDAA